jgi:hypothetical protein
MALPLPAEVVGRMDQLAPFVFHTQVAVIELPDARYKTRFRGLVTYRVTHQAEQSVFYPYVALRVVVYARSAEARVKIVKITPVEQLNPAIGAGRR